MTTGTAQRRPRLAIVTDSIQPYFSGGKEARYLQLSRRLTADFDVHVHTMKWWDGPDTIVTDGVTLHAVCRAVPMYTADGRRSIPQALLFALGCLRLLLVRFDVLEVDHMPYLHLVGLRLICWLRRRRMVVTWHEVWGRAYWVSYLGAAGHAAALVESVCMRLPDAILAASEQTAERVRAQLGPRAAVTVAPNGVDVEHMRSVPPAAGACDVVTVGRLMSHKRVDLLLAALARLRADGEPLTCRIVGSGPDRERIAAQVTALGLDGAVDLRTDVTDNDELVALVRAARVFVLASEREGFGIAALEGLACGLPVITTSARDNLAQHLVGAAPGGSVCAPDAESLAKEIHRVLHAEGVPGDEQRAWVARWSWSTITAQVSAVLRHACR